ncbi:MAG: NAD(P)/FAD-dependent oxidoreductase [Aeropyrum sp.]|nr:NAD(P)/FAD-dependent oxidoreductase [Aeropyrum sp.]MCE4615615.1 NAD(P)/FAD-dependent oxidoreductase [Aeropyrum sp.]
MARNVAIIGGGFAGLVFARNLQKLGFEVDLYEEHSVVGYPEHCTGIVSLSTIEAIGGEAKSRVIDKYRELEISFRGREAAFIRIPGGVYRLDRVGLEWSLLETFQSLGGRVYMGRRVERVTPQGVLLSGGEKTGYDAVIIAEGSAGRLRSTLSIGYSGDYYFGLNYISRMDVVGGPIRVDFRVEGGLAFTWSLPIDGSRVLEGAMGSVEGVVSLFKNRVYEKVYGGRIPAGPPARRLWSGRAFVVGDAAGLVKPVSGGGLYPSAIASKLVEKYVSQGVGLLEALMKSLSRVRGELLLQYRLSRLVYNNRLAEEMYKALSGNLPIELSLDYDRHEDLLLAIPRALGVSGVLRALSVVSRVAPMEALSTAASAALFLAVSRLTLG